MIGGKEDVKWDISTPKSETIQIEKYGGFYVGRYEAGVSTFNETTGKFENSVIFDNNASLFDTVSVQPGLNSWVWQNYNFTARHNGSLASGSNKATGNIVIKSNSIPYYHADYYTAIEMCDRLYSSHSSVRSGLITGTRLGCNYEIFTR